MSEEEIKPIEKLSLFDESKSAIEGQKNFRENAAYSWSWLVAHTKELNVALIDFNTLVFKTFEKAESVHIDADEIAENIQAIENGARHIEEIVQDIDYKFNSLKEANQATKESLELDNVNNTSDKDKPISDATQEALDNKLDNNILIVSGDFEVDDDEEFIVKELLYTGFEEDIQDSQAGEYRDFAMPNPKGSWLFCDGREISRIKYKNLFKVIGTAYGNGDGVNTFNIPDRRGLFARTLDASRGMDEDKDRKLGSLQLDELKSHSHESGFSASNQEGINAGNLTPYLASIRTGSTGGFETRPKNISVYTCIRY